MAKAKFEIYVDGACAVHESKVGGWAAVIIHTNSNKMKIIGGYEKDSTNQRMEIQAIIGTLEFLIKKVELNNNIEYSIKIYSDSAYCINCINKRWIYKWIMNGWKTNKKTDVVNRDLWEKLHNLEKQIDFQIIKVKAHNGDKYNELADKKAKEQIEKNS